MSSSFTAANYYDLITSILLFCWEPHHVDWDAYGSTRHHPRASLYIFVLPMQYVFKGFGAAAFFLYLLNAVDPTLEVFQLVPTLMIVATLLTKVWSILFGQPRWRSASILVALSALGCAAAALVYMGTQHDNDGPLWMLPVTFFSIYTLGILLQHCFMSAAELAKPFRVKVQHHARKSSGEYLPSGAPIVHMRNGV